MTYKNVREALDAYDEMLNECHEGCFNIEPARILRKLDPTWYRCGFADWLDAEGIDSDDLDDSGNDWPQ